MIQRHALPPESFAAVTAGVVDSETMHRFHLAKLDETALLLSAVLRSTPAAERFMSAVTVLSDAQKLAAQAYGELCTQSWAGIWTARCVRRLASGDGLEAEVSRLGAIAAVAALRTGLEVETWTLARDGLVILPALGAVRVSDMDSEIRLRTVEGQIIVSGRGRPILVPPFGEEDKTHWLRLRRMTARHRDRELTVCFDDLDPIRDAFGPAIADRVPRKEMLRWQTLFAQAWTLICRHAPDRAVELAGGMRVLVPLTDVGGLAGVSVSSPEAMGAMAMTRPETAARFALTLAHEQAHSTLNGLLLHHRLYDPSYTQRHFAPWRHEDRPVSGLIHGAYAFLAVAETALALAADPALRDEAVGEFKRRRAQIDQVLETLAGTDALTVDGRLFLTGLRKRCDRLLAETGSF